MSKEAERPRRTRSTTSSTKEFEQRIAKLETIIAKMAHYTGNDKILLDEKFERWSPGKKDMSKQRD